MNEFQREIAICNLSCEYLAQLRANSGDAMIRTVKAIAESARGLSREEIKGAQDWARNIHSMDLANRIEQSTAIQSAGH